MVFYYHTNTFQSSYSLNIYTSAAERIRNHEHKIGMWQQQKKRKEMENARHRCHRGSSRAQRCDRWERCVRALVVQERDQWVATLVAIVRRQRWSLGSEVAFMSRRDPGDALEPGDHVVNGSAFGIVAVVGLALHVSRVVVFIGIALWVHQEVDAELRGRARCGVQQAATRFRWRVGQRA